MDKGVITLGVVLAVLLLKRGIGFARKERQQAKAVFQSRAGHFRVLVLVAIVLVAVGSYFVFVGGVGQSVNASASAGVSASPTADPCQSHPTGKLTLTRTSPTTIAWVYIAPGRPADLYLTVDHHDVEPAKTTSGTLEVAAHPVTVHIEGSGPGGRVHVTCTG